MLKGIYLLSQDSYEKIYAPQEREDIARLVDIYAPCQTAESIKADPAVLSEAEVILSRWGCPTMDEEFLSAAPNLRAVFYGAGSMDRECRRMGRYIVEELRRYVEGVPLNWQITKEKAAILA